MQLHDLDQHRRRAAASAVAHTPAVPVRSGALFRRAAMIRAKKEKPMNFCDEIAAVMGREIERRIEADKSNLELRWESRRLADHLKMRPDVIARSPWMACPVQRDAGDSAERARLRSSPDTKFGHCFQSEKPCQTRIQ
jgi:hypothetical protein